MSRSKRERLVPPVLWVYSGLSPMWRPRGNGFDPVNFDPSQIGPKTERRTVGPDVLGKPLL